MDPDGKPLQQPNRDVPVQKGEPLEEKPSGVGHAPRVGTPVLEPERGVVLEHVQALGSADVPVPPLLDLGEDPGFDQSASRNHARRHALTLHVFDVVVVIEHVAVADDGYWGRPGALVDVIPVGESAVPLLPGPAVQGHAGEAPIRHLRDDLVRHPLVVKVSHASLQSQRAGEQRRGRADQLLHARGFLEQHGPGALVADQVDGAAHVDVDEVEPALAHDLVLEQLHASGHAVGVPAADLGAEDVLARVSPEQRPLRGMALEQVRGHGHLSAGDVDAVPLADAAEREVAGGGQRGEVELAPEIDGLLLRRSWLDIHALGTGIGIDLGPLASALVVVVASRLLGGLVFFLLLLPDGLGGFAAVLLLTVLCLELIVPFLAVSPRGLHPERLEHRVGFIESHLALAKFHLEPAAELVDLVVGAERIARGARHRELEDPVVDTRRGVARLELLSSLGRERGEELVLLGVRGRRVGAEVPAHDAVRAPVFSSCDEGAGSGEIRLLGAEVGVHVV